MTIYAYCMGCSWDRAGLNQLQAETQAAQHRRDEPTHEVLGLLLTPFVLGSEPAEVSRG